MTEDKPHVPGDSEHSLVELVEAHHEPKRKAEGKTQDGRRVTVYTHYESEQWGLSVTVADRVATTSREVEYPSRGDLYRAFDFLVEKHDLEEITHE